eukprot:CAMPEP_0178913174 /NCGR_PEP_ID=MMETSP0786-20121207/10691_1 /TAXON_ID=186022 /ORGANISM="Thalassionema frauenfeldii, Strain CCMP 1798" /LENGTH=314 /DNA_ID=CAMNT_0020585877 /DNA_START=26 /DNA_END=970 /DNA_ORIENTATION=-
MERNAKTTCIGCTCIIVILLIVILVPLSFSYIEYYEYGLIRNKFTGKIDTSEVYERGRYFLGIEKEFRKYQADAHFEELVALPVFSNGESEDSVGLSFKIDVDFTFLLKKDEIGDLHRELASTYREVIVSKATEAIKNEAIFISFTQYFQERKLVEQRFRESVQKRWDTKPSVHCVLDQFHLGRIYITPSVAEKQMVSRIQIELNDRESFLQQAQLERELTAVQVNEKLLTKDKTLRTAQAEASLTRAKAQAEATRLTAEAQINGTKLLFEATEITQQTDMTAFTYIRTLANRDNVQMDVSYLEPDSVIRTKNA